MATTSARLTDTIDDAELATLATTGDGDAFAELYDRHERRVFGFCLRMLGSEDEAADATQETFMRLLRRLPAMQRRDVNFAAYALAAARNACYDMIDSRRRVEPVAEQLEPPRSEPGDVTLDPERAALLNAAREDVQKANAALPARHREVLALRELEQLSYEQIGELVGLNSNAVAQLISRARIKLRDLIQGGALEAIAVSSPDCARALPLLARVQDSQRNATDEVDWLGAHLSRCERCRASRAAMEEAGVSYRALGPIVALAWLRHTTIARAAEQVGADWSHLVDHGPAAASSGSRAHARRGHGARMPSAAGDGVRESLQALRRSSLLGLGDLFGRRSLGWLVAVVALSLALLAALAASITPDGRILPQALTSVSSAARTKTVRAPPGERTRNPASTRHRVRATPDGGLGSAPPAAGPASIVAQTTATPPVHRGSPRGSKRRSKRAPHAPPTTPTTPAPPPPPATTPAATVPTPSPPTTTTTPSSGGQETTPPPKETKSAPPETPAPTPGEPAPRGPLGG